MFGSFDDKYATKEELELKNAVDLIAAKFTVLLSSRRTLDISELTPVRRDQLKATVEILESVIAHKESELLELLLNRIQQRAAKSLLSAN